MRLKKDFTLHSFYMKQQAYPYHRVQRENPFLKKINIKTGVKEKERRRGMRENIISRLTYQRKAE